MLTTTEPAIKDIKTKCPSVCRVELKLYKRVGWEFIEVIICYSLTKKTLLEGHISQFNQYKSCSSQYTPTNIRQNP